MTPPATIVFDLDGTLIDTAPDLAVTVNALLRRRGRRAVPLAEVRTMVGHGAIAMMGAGMAATGTAASDEDLKGMLDEFIEHYGTNIAVNSRPFPGAVEALDELEAAGYQFALCTNKREDLARILMTELGLGHRFRVILGGDTLDVCKPDPRHLTEAILRSGGALERSVMVGDSVTDVAAARAAAVPIVGVSFGYTQTPMAELEPDCVIDHFGDLRAAIDKIIVRG